MVYGVDKGVVLPIGPFDTEDEACDHLTYLFNNMGADAKVGNVHVDHVRVIECVTPSEVDNA
jgi:hypothetical protein